MWAVQYSNISMIANGALTRTNRPEISDKPIKDAHTRRRTISMGTTA